MGGEYMKRSFLLAISVMALTIVSDQLLAAEAETPAERAAPAARQRAPARERARPAPMPQRQAASQPSSSFTGTQAGGFGGGNAGGGGFSDKALLSQLGVCNQMFGPNMTASSTPMQMPCTPGPGANGSMPAKFTLAGVISFDTPKIPVLLAGGNVVLIGAVIDIATAPRLPVSRSSTRTPRHRRSDPMPPASGPTKP